MHDQFEQIRTVLFSPNNNKLTFGKEIFGFYYCFLLTSLRQFHVSTAFG